MRVLRAGDRFVTDGEGIRTAHCFSFGAHFDPTNTGFAALVACNDEQVAPGHGYDLHRHSDAEIVSWVVGGTLTHEDGQGHRVDLKPGSVQRLSAGRGARHVERNASAAEPLRFVQMWLRPDRGGTEPTYECDLPRLRSGVWTDVAGGSAAVGVGTSGATLRVARLEAGESVVPPASGWCHLFVTSGSVAVEDSGFLGDGDSLRLTGQRPLLRAQAAAELLAWQLTAQRPASR